MWFPFPYLFLSVFYLLTFPGRCLDFSRWLLRKIIGLCYSIGAYNILNIVDPAHQVYMFMWLWMWSNSILKWNFYIFSCLNTIIQTPLVNSILVSRSWSIELIKLICFKKKWLLNCNKIYKFNTLSKANWFPCWIEFIV